jgi:hypothetical protein
MDRILYKYELNPTTWVYLSSLLTIAIFFKFSRFWSVRNFDLLGLLAISPGLLMIAYGQEMASNPATPERPAALGEAPDSRVTPRDGEGPGSEAPESATADDEARAFAARVESWGYVYLFVIGVLFLVRLLADPMMVRRPLLEPNLSTGGLTFLAVALFVFLTANAFKPQAEQKLQAPQPSAVEAAEGAAAGSGNGGAGNHGDAPPEAGAAGQDDGAPARPYPRYPLLLWLEDTFTAKALATVAQLALVVGLVLIGRRHYENVWTGVAMATLYLLLPVTGRYFGHVDHVLPAALLVWAIEEYRYPTVAGVLFGLAMGAIYFPVFLLPLWLAFYWHRGLWRFLISMAATITALTAALVLFSANFGELWQNIKLMFGLAGLMPEQPVGFWATHGAPYRIPVITLFVVMCGSMAIWPAQKNLGTLISCSAAVMLATQFWYAQGGLTYFNWYMPLLLLTMFRPNLEHRMALSSLGVAWFARRRVAAPQAA